MNLPSEGPKRHDDVHLDVVVVSQLSSEWSVTVRPCTECDRDLVLVRSRGIAAAADPRFQRAVSRALGQGEL